jgi:hypothetical protein
MSVEDVAPEPTDESSHQFRNPEGTDRRVGGWWVVTREHRPDFGAAGPQGVSHGALLEGHNPNRPVLSEGVNKSDETPIGPGQS